MVRLVTADAPDVVALQEVPVWGIRELERWSGMAAAWAIAMPPLLGPLARRLTELDPQRFRSAFTGQANALLVNPHFEAGRHRRLVLNPGLSRRDWLLHGGHRRVCHSLEIEVAGERLVLANLHASKAGDLGRAAVSEEVARAAAFLAGAERCVLCGDFNVRRLRVPGFSEPAGGIDQVLVRGAALERGPEAWPDERRRVDGRLLSDHPPVEAVVAWS